MSSPNAEIVRSQVGDLPCVQIQLLNDQEELVTPQLLVVLCHGYGAGGEDLVPCAGELLSCLPHELRPKVRFLFPAAPLVLSEMYGMDSRAWWPIDMAELERAMQSGTFREMRNNDVPEMDNAREKLRACISEVLEQQNLTWSQTILGGFSQGSMVTTDLAIDLEQRPAGLIVWSGTVIRQPRWTAAVEAAPLRREECAILPPKTTPISCRSCA